MAERKENCARVIFTLASLVSVLVIILISGFLFSSSFSTLQKIGLKEFLFGTTWRPSNMEFGILPMIAGSFALTILALVLALPCGLFTAVYISRYAGKRMKKYSLFAVNLLSGIPSVIYGFFGLVVVVPMIRTLFGGTGTSMLAGSLILAIMVLPTIVSISVPALDSIDKAYYEGALALGANHEEAVFKIILPAARSGIFAAIVLAIGRAIGEATAVVMVAGNQPRFPQGLTKGLRTMTGNVIIEMGYATDLHQEALIATGALLFLFIFIINFLIFKLKQRGEKL